MMNSFGRSGLDILTFCLFLAAALRLAGRVRPAGRRGPLPSAAAEARVRSAEPVALLIVLAVLAIVADADRRADVLPALLGVAAYIVVRSSHRRIDASAVSPALTDEDPLGLIEDEYRLSGFAVEGEDLMTLRIFKGLFHVPEGYCGTYVDIGAADPVRASNTYLLYKQGWRGFNIEPSREAHARLQRFRPYDVNINLGVAGTAREARYCRWDEPLLNGFLPEAVIDHHLRRGHVLLGQDLVACRPIGMILEEAVAGELSIDVLSMDIELMELEVLQTWPFEKWRPRVIILEIQRSETQTWGAGRPVFSIGDIAASAEARLLEARGYVFFSRLWHSSIFIDLRAITSIDAVSSGGGTADSARSSVRPEV